MDYDYLDECNGILHITNKNLRPLIKLYNEFDLPVLYAFTGRSIYGRIQTCLNRYDKQYAIVKKIDGTQKNSVESIFVQNDINTTMYNSLIIDRDIREPILNTLMYCPDGFRYILINISLNKRIYTELIVTEIKRWATDHGYQIEEEEVTKSKMSMLFKNITPDTNEC